MTNPLPQGWAFTRVVDIFSAHGGGTPSRSNSSLWNGPIPWLSSGDIKSDIVCEGTETITEAGLSESSARLCRPGSVLVVVRSGILKHTLPVAITSQTAAINQDIKCFDSGNDDLNRWLAIVLRASERVLLAENREGTTVQSVKFETLRNFNLAIPPLEELRRIVAKLEKLLDRVDSCQKRLAKIPILLKRFRQAVLAAACSGALTLEWREKSQFCSESEDLDLPGGWNWQTIHNLVGSSGLFDGPFGSNLKTADYTAHGVRVVRLENIGHLKFLNEKKAFISEQKYQSLRKHTVRGGDIIFSSFIDEEIRVCALPPLPTQAIAKADCFCLRPSGDSVDNRYLTLQLASRATYDRLLEKVHGATRPRINTTQLRDLIVPICSPDEQQEIVRRVDELIALADQVEARYAKAKQYVDNLEESILAKAFRGELVPQDPNDEPASVLIERIREAGTTPQPDRSDRRGKKSGPSCASTENRAVKSARQVSTETTNIAPR